MFDVVIIGSGLSGVAAALGFTKKGIKPCLIDVGSSPGKEPPITENFYELRKKTDSFSLMLGENLEGMHPHRVGQSDTNYELFYRASSSIYPKGSMTMGEFSTALSVPLSTATRIADWLVDNGYFQRLNDSEDRRVVRIALTDNGRGLYKAIDKYIKQRLQNILSCLNDEEMKAFLVLVRKIVDRLKETAQ